MADKIKKFFIEILAIVVSIIIGLAVFAVMYSLGIRRESHILLRILAISTFLPSVYFGTNIVWYLFRRRIQE